MSRILAVARLQALGRRDGLLWPLVILAIAFAVNLAVFGAAGDAFDETPFTGGLSSVYITAIVFGAIAIIQHFPFALGMSVTRREFSAALGLFVVAQSLLYGVLLVILQTIEDATGGWGMDLRFFGLGFIDDHGVLAQLLIYAVPMLLMSLIGVTLGALFVRWNVNGVFIAIGGLLLAAGGAVALITRAGRWSAIGDWLTAQNVLTLLVALPLTVVVLLAGTAWTALRRTTA